jgi:hypothetical protein
VPSARGRTSRSAPRCRLSCRDRSDGDAQQVIGGGIHINGCRSPGNR